ncbi:MAG: PAS domain-containing protein, partial [Cyclobacteriaceae bacterium]|nr:PAS domain-containing protein [Cyclobacteriaceae bacterium]
LDSTEAATRLAPIPEVPPLIQTMRDSVLVVSPQKEILFYNQAAKKLLHCEEKENIPRPLCGTLP